MLVPGKAPRYKDDPCGGGKQSKGGIRVQLACNTERNNRLPGLIPG